MKSLVVAVLAVVVCHVEAEDLTTYVSPNVSLLMVVVALELLDMLTWH